MIEVFKDKYSLRNYLLEIKILNTLFNTLSLNEELLLKCTNGSYNDQVENHQGIKVWAESRYVDTKSFT